jgi:hypothetical protein
MSNEKVLSELLGIRTELLAQTKRAIKNRTAKGTEIKIDIRDRIVDLFNKFTQLTHKSWTTFTEQDKKEVKKCFLSFRDKTIRAFQAIDVNYLVPNTCIEIIDPNIIDDELSESELDMATSAIDFFNLASKLIPSEFNGSVDKLQTFLDALTLLSLNVGENENNAVAFIKTRLVGKARDLVTTETTILQIKEALSKGIKGESSRNLSQKLLNLKQNNKDNTAFAADIELLADKLKKSYISEGVPNEIAETYATDTSVRALCLNATAEKARLIMEAGSFRSIQEVVTKFSSLPYQNNQTNNVFYINRNNNRGFRSNNNRGQKNNRRGNSRPFSNNNCSNGNNRQYQPFRQNNQNHHNQQRRNVNNVRFLETNIQGNEIGFPSGSTTEREQP